jgi:hypothetical protein
MSINYPTNKQSQNDCAVPPRRDLVSPKLLFRNISSCLLLMTLNFCSWAGWIRRNDELHITNRHRQLAAIPSKTIIRGAAALPLSSSGTGPRLETVFSVF